MCICKQFAKNLVNEQGGFNLSWRGGIPRFSDLKVAAFNMASESIGIDGDSLLFVKLREASIRDSLLDIPIDNIMIDENLQPSLCCHLCKDGRHYRFGEDYFYRFKTDRSLSSSSCHTMFHGQYRKSSIIWILCITATRRMWVKWCYSLLWPDKSGVYDIHYLKDVKLDYSNNTVIGNRRLYQYWCTVEFLKTTHIWWEVPYRSN